MNQTTKETRRRSYDAVLPKRAARCRLILETLGNRELTASEITEELVAAGRIPYFNRNYVAPRLTEFGKSGIRSQKFSAFPSCSLSNLLEYICTLTD